MKPGKFLILLSAGVFLALCTSVRASSAFFVYNSFGPGFGYNTSVSWAVAGAATPRGYRGQAEWFVPGTSGYLSSIQVALSYFGGSGIADFYVTLDNNGTPGTVLENFVIASPGIVTLPSALNPLLQAGVKYWVAAEPADDASNLGWYQNNQGAAPGFAFERAPWTWQASVAPPPNPNPASGVFNVSVTAVPEPAPAALFVILGGCLFARRFLRTRA